MTDMKRAGIHHLAIMGISVDKTMACFTRYNSFREPDLQAAAHQLTTYLTLASKPRLRPFRSMGKIRCKLLV